MVTVIATACGAHIRAANSSGDRSMASMASRFVRLDTGSSRLAVLANQMVVMASGRAAMRGLGGQRQHDRREQHRRRIQVQKNRDKRREGRTEEKEGDVVAAAEDRHPGRDHVEDLRLLGELRQHDDPHQEHQQRPDLAHALPGDRQREQPGGHEDQTEHEQPDPDPVEHAKTPQHPTMIAHGMRNADPTGDTEGMARDGRPTQIFVSYSPADEPGRHGSPGSWRRPATAR